MLNVTVGSGEDMREAGVPERASPAARLFHGSEPRKRADGRTKSAILNTGIDPSRVTGEDMREAGISERDFPATRRLAPGCRSHSRVLQVYLAHRKQPPPLGPSDDPRYSRTVVF